MEKLGSGISDKHPGSATMILFSRKFYPVFVYQNPGYRLDPDRYSASNAGSRLGLNESGSETLIIITYI